MRRKRKGNLYVLCVLVMINVAMLLYTQRSSPIDGVLPPKSWHKSAASFYAQVNIYNNVNLAYIQKQNRNKVTFSAEEDLIAFNRDSTSDDESGEDIPIFPEYNLLLNPKKCSDEESVFQDIFLLVLVTSRVRNFNQRKAIRKTWGNQTVIDGHKVLTLFLMGVNHDASHHYMDEVQEEYSNYGDIIMEDFADTYMNLTLKSIMGFKWMNYYCPVANYVMKTDDDMFINLNYTIAYLHQHPASSKNFVMGFVINAQPIRDKKNKWYMPYDLYPYYTYPPFTSGTCYVMSGDVTIKTYDVSRMLRYLHLEDIFSALCWEKLRIIPRKHNGFNLQRVPYSYCKYQQLISVHNIRPYKMLDLWKHFTNDSLTKSRYYCLFNGWFF